jgi:putative ABC transport system ATP-binding protein
MNDLPANNDRPPILRVDRVSRVYPDGDVTALCDVSLSVAAGEYVAIMGPSGSGKSTLLDLPTSGEVYLDGQALSTCRHLAAVRAHKIGFVFQSFHLLPTLTACENVQVPMFEGSLSARQRAERARELLALVGLSDRAEHLPSQLSVGQRQRVAIARSLANEPPLLLADEPTGNLDSHSGRAVLELFDALHREHGLTLIVITHSAEVAARAERTLWIRDGRLTRAEE